jgi:hypothetical protein
MFVGLAAWPRAIGSSSAVAIHFHQNRRRLAHRAEPFSVMANRFGAETSFRDWHDAPAYFFAWAAIQFLSLSPARSRLVRSNDAQSLGCQHPPMPNGDNVRCGDLGDLLLRCAFVLFSDN